jgi:hypothetical protein
MRGADIDDCIEKLCQKGCKAVRDDILALEQGRSLAETEGLSAEQRGRVLAELKSIMAVYGDTCRPPF